MNSPMLCIGDARVSQLKIVSYNPHRELKLYELLDPSSSLPSKEAANISDASSITLYDS